MRTIWARKEIEEMERRRRRTRIINYSKSKVAVGNHEHETNEDRLAKKFGLVMPSILLLQKVKIMAGRDASCVFLCDAFIRGCQETTAIVAKIFEADQWQIPILE